MNPLFRGYGQHDSHEAVSSFIDSLHEQTKEEDYEEYKEPHWIKTQQELQQKAKQAAQNSSSTATNQKSLVRVKKKLTHGAALWFISNWIQTLAGSKAATSLSQYGFKYLWRTSSLPSPLPRLL